MTIGRETTMKNSIKLIFSIFTCGLMLLSGCGSTLKSSLPSELRGPAADYPNTVNIIAPDFFESAYAENAEQIKQQWLDEMSQRYRVKLNIISNSYKDSENSDRTASNQRSDVLSSKTTFDGLISVSSGSLSLGLFYDVLMPLEDYLNNNPTWNALPEDFKSLFEENGHIYAIPTYLFRAQNARYIYNDATAMTGITVTDLESLQKFAVAYQKAEDSAAFGSMITTGLEDIFNAFGLYPNDLEQFNYDPTEGCYVDMLTKAAAVDALEYLRGLYNTGALDYGVTKDTGNMNFYNGIYPSHYHQYFDVENCSEILSLNPKYPQIAFTQISGFAMTKDTTQPKETVDFLVNMVFGSEENYLECWLGLQNSYMINSDGSITVEMPQDSHGKYVYPCMPYLAGGLTNIFPHSDANLFFRQNGAVTAESITEAEKYNALSKQFYDSLKNGSVFEIPQQYRNIKSQTYEANKNFTGNWYADCLKNAITNPDYTVQQAIDEYLAAMLNIGGNQMLDEMNAAIGKETAYYYG